MNADWYQKDTAQVYNLVLGDTIEGRIYLLLESKLEEIARTLGKANEAGVVTEDLRAQILGQLYERISYDELYREALKDPALKRTREELAAAMDNAKQARVAVNELFQDLERFSLNDYKPFSDTRGSLRRIALFLEDAVADGPLRLRPCDPFADAAAWELRDEDGARLKRFATDREQVKQDETLELLGLDHALVAQQIRQWQAIPAGECGVVVKGAPAAGVLSCWRVEVHAPSGERSIRLLHLAATKDGKRLPVLERNPEALLSLPPGSSALEVGTRTELLNSILTPMVDREIRHKGMLPDGGSYRAELLLWVEAE